MSWLAALRQDKGGLVLVGVLLLLMVYVPVATLLLPADHVLHLDVFTATLLGKYLCYAILAITVDMVWGYLGILSLGHGAFFALGGYAMGMYLMRQIGDRGVYGDPLLPDFMVFLNWQELPWYWFGMDNLAVALLMVVLVPAALAFVVGALAFRSRVTGVYLSIITQAMTYALMLAFFRNEMGFGGNNGLTDFKEIAGFSLRQDETRIALFMLTAFTLLMTYCLCRWMMSSRLGRLSCAIRDEESRVRFIGYDVNTVKLWIFVVSASLAGIAGALYVPQVGIINPGEFSPLNSIELVIWVAVGGRGTLYGAVVGAVLVNYGKTMLTGLMPESWVFVLGALFVLVTLYLPNGIVSLIKRRRAA